MYICARLILRRKPTALLRKDTTMTRFENKLCPVCRTRFNDKADIVVCPECGTPHHRACYCKKNECALNSLHASGWQWNGRLPDEEPASTEIDSGSLDVERTESDAHHAEYPSGTPYANEERMFDELGDENPFKELFSSLNDKEIGEDGVSMHELVAYSATSVYHYGKSFKIFRDRRDGKKHRISFNFCSGLLAPVFQFYRKMNIFGILVTLIQLAPQMIIASVSDQFIRANSVPLSVLFDVVRIALMLILCIFGDYIYYKHCVKSIVKFRKCYDGDTLSDEYYMALYESGKPTLAGALIGALAAAFLQTCILVFAGRAV